MAERAFHTVTLGCKLNQFDTAAIEGELAVRGFRPADSSASASVVIVNTCTVTHRADADARQTIRRLHRENPNCELWVTGCYAEREPKTLREIPGVTRVFGNREKHRVAQFLEAAGFRTSSPHPDAEIPPPPPDGDRGCDEAVRSPRALHFGAKTRAFLRIQDGCRLACSYCIIPSVRGGSRSVSPENVLRVAVHLWRSGYREIVLTGVNSGDWGRDLTPRNDLESLLRTLLAHAGENRLRLNSLEPLTVTDGIIDLMRDDSRLAPHLQVPLQSGSARTLAAMRRNYRPDAYIQRLDRLRDAVPHVGLGADVIVGFPGESEEQFQETYDLVATSPLNYLHVFSWSARPGTPASLLEGRIDERTIRDRNRALRQLAVAKSLEFRRQQIGQTRQALVLEPKVESTELRALTDNFFEVTLPRDSSRAGALIDVVLLKVDGAATLAIPRDRPTA